MAKLKIYNDIVDEEQKLCMAEWGAPEGVCFKDVKEFIESIPEDDNVIDIRLHCCGGDCGEGWSIYDHFVLPANRFQLPSKGNVRLSLQSFCLLHPLSVVTRTKISECACIIRPMSI